MTKAVTRPSRCESQEKVALKFAEIQMTYQEIADRFGVTTRAVTCSHDRAILKLWKLANDPELAAAFDAIQ